jgi:hypothetical protein
MGEPQAVTRLISFDCFSKVHGGNAAALEAARHLVSPF